MSEGAMAPVELVLSEKHAFKVVDREEIERVKSGSSKNAGLGAGQGVIHKLEALLAQIRSAVKRQAIQQNVDDGSEDIYQSVRDVFCMFAVDGIVGGYGGWVRGCVGTSENERVKREVE
jgi:hypothetical protein